MVVKNGGRSIGPNRRIQGSDDTFDVGLGMDKK
jgi:hypothetical protein